MAGPCAGGEASEGGGEVETCCDDHGRRVAAVTDSGFLSVLPRFAAHFVRAEIKHFPYSDKQQALDWLLAAKVCR